VSERTELTWLRVWPNGGPIVNMIMNLKCRNILDLSNYKFSRNILNIELIMPRLDLPFACIISIGNLSCIFL
jgi:hypothetical protein